MGHIAVSNNMLFITTLRNDVHKITVDADYNIVTSELFVAHSELFDHPLGISVWDSHVIVVCSNSHNLHIFNQSGSHVVPPVRKFGSGRDKLHYPVDVVTDIAGRIYVADYGNERIILFSPAGEFIRILVGKADGLAKLYPSTLYIQNNYLYVVTIFPDKLYVIELE